MKKSIKGGYKVMIDAVLAYIKTITAMTVFITLASLLMPNGTMRQYTKWVLGMLLLTSMLEPLFSLCAQITGR